ncbi:gem (nuclear organelle) associated protein 2 [Blyttiomyces sp. JEL0837]|nr:gem (nuclear organelle) associated protein 2 [Blyttiomyces sp. JEL0837]
MSRFLPFKFLQSIQLLFETHNQNDAEQQSSHNDDDEGLRRRGLPIDDYIESSDPLAHGIPASGLEYLRMVRREAESCAQVVVATITPEKLQTITRTPNIENVRQKYFGTLAKETVPSMPAYLRANPDWLQAFLKEFDVFKKTLDREIANDKKKRMPPYCPFKPPRIQEEQKWKQWMYGSQNESRAGISSSASDMNGTSTTTAEGIDEMAIETDTNSRFAVGSAPFLLIISQLDHILCRKCQRIRRNLVKNGVFVDGMDVERDFRVVGLRFVVAIITRYFGQRDLSDDVGERAPESKPDSGLPEVFRNNVTIDCEMEG